MILGRRSERRERVKASRNWVFKVAERSGQLWAASADAIVIIFHGVVLVLDTFQYPQWQK